MKRLGWCRFFGVACLVGLAALAFGLPAAAQNTDVRIGVGDTTVLISGSTSPGATITFIDGTNVVGSVVADVAGAYSKHFTGQTPGIHTFKVFAQDVNGHFTDTVKVEANLTEHFETQIEVFLPPTIQYGSTSLIQGEVLSISGTTIPDATVIVYVNSASGSSIADAAGEWSFNIQTASLQPGQHEFYVVASKSGGQMSFASQARTFTVLAPSSSDSSDSPTQPPAAIGPTRPSVPTITWPKSGDIIDGGTIDVVGISDPEVRIELWNRGQNVGSSFADAYGRWAITATFTQHSNSLQVRACIGTICSEFSGATPFYRQLPADGLRLTLEQYHLEGAVGGSVLVKSLVQGGEPPYKMAIEWGDGARNQQLNPRADTTFSHRYLKEGSYKGKLVVADSGNRHAVASFTVEVHKQRSSGFSWGLFLFVLTAIILLPLVIVWKIRR